MIRIRMRNGRGTIRTDFGARWKTAPLERFANREFQRRMLEALLTGEYGTANPPPPGQWGMGPMLKDPS